MSTGGVEFEEDSYSGGSMSSGSKPINSNFRNSPAGYSNSYNESDGGGIGGWLVRHHLAKTPQAAQKIMIGIAVFNFTVAIIALYYYL